MSEFETLQTFFLGLIAIAGTVGTTFGVFILKKLDCFQNMFSEDRERIAKLETVREIYHPRTAI